MFAIVICTLDSLRKGIKMKGFCLLLVIIFVFSWILLIALTLLFIISHIDWLSLAFYSLFWHLYIRTLVFTGAQAFFLLSYSRINLELYVWVRGSGTGWNLLNILFASALFNLFTPVKFRRVLVIVAEWFWHSLLLGSPLKIFFNTMQYGTTSKCRVKWL